MQPIPRRQAALAPPAVPVSEAPPALVLPPAVAAAVWRGDQLGHATLPTRPSGFAALDAELPGGGWPCQGLTELLCPQPGTLEWRLLAPLLRALCPAGGIGGGAAGGAARPAASTPVLLVGPPHPPHPPGLRADGISERGLVWLQAHTVAERLWTTEQLLKARAPGVLVAWLPQARPEQLRRLQVLAGAAQGPVFVCRPQAAAREASAAPLRLLVRVGAGGTAGVDDGPWSLQVDLLKRPGPPLARTLCLSSVPGGLGALLPPRLRVPPRPVPAPVPAPVAGPVPVAATALENDHVVVRPAAARSVWH